MIFRMVSRNFWMAWNELTDGVDELADHNTDLTDAADDLV